MSEITYGEINDAVLDATEPPRLRSYYVAVALLAAGAAMGLACWAYQTRVGLIVTGLNTPVGWAFYITNFVFWIGIGHAGTLISAILYLVRSRWRTAVSRSAEAMTVFAVMTAGLFPMIHLGRLWVFYYILPYPSQRQIWPNFLSPLVWDVCAVSTYLTVSTIFWYVGLVPDLGAARDRWAAKCGWGSLRARLYRRLSLGWSGAGAQWRHYGRGYLFFAALATPLVISVHSIVSWDFAMSNLPGWHTTIFAPYFVAGAIHSGLAMVLLLVIPMRRILRLEKVITLRHFEAVALTMIVTGLIMGYSYGIESFISWYSGDTFERQFMVWRATGWVGPLFWMMVAFNVAAPMALLVRRVRLSLAGLFIVSLFVNAGMWIERFVIIAGSLSHDFLPHNWFGYAPRIELPISIASLCFFLLWFFIFAKTAPTVSISDVKEDTTEGARRYQEMDAAAPPVESIRGARRGVMAVYRNREPLLEALRKARQAGFHRLETYSPVRLREAEALMGRGPSPVRFWTLAGAVFGVTGGFSLAIGAALVNGLLVGAKPPVSPIPYCIVGFEGMILCGTLANLAAVLAYGRMGPSDLPPGYDLRFQRDRFGLFLACAAEQDIAARTLLVETQPEEVKVVEADA